MSDLDKRYDVITHALIVNKRVVNTDFEEIEIRCKELTGDFAGYESAVEDITKSIPHRAVEDIQRRIERLETRGRRFLTLDAELLSYLESGSFTITLSGSGKNIQPGVSDFTNGVYNHRLYPFSKIRLLFTQPPSDQWEVFKNGEDTPLIFDGVNGCDITIDGSIALELSVYEGGKMVWKTCKYHENEYYVLEDVLNCPDCGLPFGQDPYYCVYDGCGEKFASESERQVHYDEVHGSDDEGGGVGDQYYPCRYWKYHNADCGSVRNLTESERDEHELFVHGRVYDEAGGELGDGGHDVDLKSCPSCGRTSLHYSVEVCPGCGHHFIV